MFINFDGWVRALLQSRFSSSIQLSIDELLVLGTDLNKEYAPKHSKAVKDNESYRFFSTKQLRQMSQEITQRYFIKQSLNQKNAVCRVLPVDPRHLHVYWKFPGDAHETIPENKNLKVIFFLQPEADKVSTVSTKISTYVPSGYITLAIPDIHRSDVYSVAVAQVDDNQQLTNIIYSNPVLVDVCPDSAKLEGVAQKREGEHYFQLNVSGKGLLSS